MVYNLFLIKTGTTNKLSNIYDSEFENNTLTGSVVNIVEGAITVGSSSFLNNNGSALGPLIKAFGSSIIMENSNVTGDLAITDTYTTKSGVFYLLESSLKLNNCSITGGKGTNAGALYSTASTIEILDSLFNASTTSNAALYSSSDL